MNLRIRPATPCDHEVIGELHRQAFGGEYEAELVSALEQSGDARLSLLAEADGEVLGHVLFSRLTIETPVGPVAALALAPAAVRPSHQRQGIGSRLIEAGLQRCREGGEQIVVVLGHPEYYPRFGFSAPLAESLSAPFSGPAFMAVELQPGALAGVTGSVHYPPAFGMASA